MTTIIDISPKNVYGKCDLKCAYNFNYSGSNSTAKNNGIVISLTYDNSSVPPVIYNNQKYSVSKLNLYSPSLHLFNGSKTNAELIVEHVPVAGGDPLYVCVPIVQSNNSSTASSLLTQVIQGVSSNAPSNGDSTNLNLSGFTLQDIIPKKPYYSYANTTSGVSGDYLVFGKFEAISIDEKTITTLSEIITEFPLDMIGDKLFYNPNGPNNDVGNQGIYISCQPTGSSEEKIDVTTAKNQPIYDLSSILNNPIYLFILQIILGGVLFITLFFVINYIFKYFSASSKVSNSNS